MDTQKITREIRMKHWMQIIVNVNEKVSQFNSLSGFADGRKFHLFII
ncbi:hypothetical protein ACT26D_11285 [Megasphaera elsdenii]